MQTATVFAITRVQGIAGQMKTTMASAIIRALDVAGWMQTATVFVTIRVPAGGMWMKMEMASAIIKAQAGEEWGAGLREAAACKNGVM